VDDELVRLFYEHHLLRCWRYPSIGSRCVVFKLGTIARQLDFNQISGDVYFDVGNQDLV
jgi:hypothetical protein